jgi:hypothetical protein
MPPRLPSTALLGARQDPDLCGPPQPIAAPQHPPERLARNAVVAVPAAAFASATTSPVVGHVYVDDNTAGANTIGAFDRHADGARRTSDKTRRPPT